MYEFDALVELLERKGVLTRQEIYDASHELQQHSETTTLERLSTTGAADRGK